MFTVLAYGLLHLADDCEAILWTSLDMYVFKLVLAGSSS